MAPRCDNLKILPSWHITAALVDTFQQFSSSLPSSSPSVTRRKYFTTPNDGDGLLLLAQNNVLNAIKVSQKATKMLLGSWAENYIIAVDCLIRLISGCQWLLFSPQYVDNLIISIPQIWACTDIAIIWAIFPINFPDFSPVIPMNNGKWGWCYQDYRILLQIISQQLNLLQSLNYHLF